MLLGLLVVVLATKQSGPRTSVSWEPGTAGKCPSVMGEKVRVRDLSSQGCAGFPGVMEALAPQVWSLSAH